MNADKSRDLVCWGRCGWGRRTHWATLMAMAARSCLHGREDARNRFHGCTDVWGRCRGHTGCSHGGMGTRSRSHGHKAVRVTVTGTRCCTQGPASGFLLPSLCPEQPMSPYRPGRSLHLGMGFLCPVSAGVFGFTSRDLVKSHIMARLTVPLYS